MSSLTGSRVEKQVPLSPFDCCKSNFAALLNSIITAVCVCLGSGECIYDVQDPLHVISATAGIVPYICLQTAAT